MSESTASLRPNNNTLKEPLNGSSKKKRRQTMPYEIDPAISGNTERYRRSSLPYDAKLAYEAEVKAASASILDKGLQEPTRLKNRRKSVDFDPDAYEFNEDDLPRQVDGKVIMFGEPSTTDASSPTSKLAISMTADLSLSPRSAQVQQLNFVGQNTKSIPLFSLLDIAGDSNGNSNDYITLGLHLMITEDIKAQQQSLENYPLNKNLLSEEAIKKSLDHIKTWNPAVDHPDVNLLKPIGEVSLEGYWGLLDYFNCLVETWIMQSKKRNAKVLTVFPDKVIGSFHDYAQRAWKPQDQKNTKPLINNENGVRGFNEELIDPIPNRPLDRKFASQLWRGLLWLCPDFYVFDKVLDNGNSENTGPPSVLFNLTPLNPITRKPVMGGQPREAFEARRMIVLRRLLFLQFLHQRDYLYCCLPKKDPLCKKIEDCMTEDPMLYQWNSRFISFLRACLWSYLIWPYSSNNTVGVASLSAKRQPFDRFPLIFRGGVFNSVRKGCNAWPESPEEGLLISFAVASLLHERFKSYRTIVTKAEEDELKEFRYHPMDYVIRYLERKDSRESSESPTLSTIVPKEDGSPRRFVTPKRRGRGATAKAAGALRPLSRSATPLRSRLFDAARLRKNRELEAAKILQKWNDLKKLLEIYEIVREVLPYINSMWSRNQTIYAGTVSGDVKFSWMDIEAMAVKPRSGTDRRKDSTRFDLNIIKESVRQLFILGREANAWTVLGDMDYLVISSRGGKESDGSSPSGDIEKVVALVVRCKEDTLSKLRAEESDIIEKYGQRDKKVGP